MTRIESPSSINTFNTCKRKYYYSYKLNLPRTESISTITGKAVHSALENFFKIDLKTINALDYENELKFNLINLFNSSWQVFLPELLKLNSNKEKIIDYYRDSLSMLNNFIVDFISGIKKEKLNFEEAFNKLKPKTEVYISSEKYNVHGYIDCILEIGDELYVIDYKTGNRDVVSDDYVLQLAIYGLLVNEKYGRLPSKLALHFLRQGTKKFVDVNDGLIENAKKECELIRVNTESDDIKDYEKNPGYYCKWRDGQCSFYDLCFGVKKLNDYSDLNLQVQKN